MDLLTVFLLALVPLDDVISQNTHNASACFGSDGSQCNTLTLDKCSNSARIYIRDQNYGVKVGSCRSIENQCLTPGSGCCAYKEGDCLANYTPYNSYNLYRQCSGKSSCKTLASRQSNINCNGLHNLSTYATISYSCVSEVINFCDQPSTSSESVHIIFDQNTSKFTAPSHCSCSVSSNQKLSVNFVDIRMAKAHTEALNTDCSSAWLNSDPQIKLPKKCDNDADDYLNFVNQTDLDTNVWDLRLELNDLYRLGTDDSPVFVWILVQALNNAKVYVECKRSGFDPTSTTTTKVTTDPTATTQPSTQLPNSTITGALDDGSSSGAIVGGVIAAAVVLLLIAGVIFYILVYKRRGCPVKVIKLRRGTPGGAVTNMSNKSHSEEYAEIGFVPDMSPVENQNYQNRVTSGTEPSTRPRANDYSDSPSGSGHTYQNTGGNHPFVQATILPQKAPTSSGTFAKIRQQTSRFVALFIKSPDNQLKVSSEPRVSNVSTGSYDHIKTFKTVEISLPIADRNHVYSHTNHQDTFDLKPSGEVNSKSTGDSQGETKQTEIERELSAVHIGDQYIEFTFDSVEDDKKVHFTMGTEKRIPDPPKREPPSPGHSSNLRPNTPTVLTPNPLLSKPVNDISNAIIDNGEGTEFGYDYASESKHSLYPVIGNNLPRHSGSGVGEIQINGNPTEYDYADTDEVDKSDKLVDEPGAIYEDVDAKHQMEADDGKKYMRQDSQGYLAPVSRTSELSTDTKHMYVNRITSNVKESSVS